MNGLDELLKENPAIGCRVCGEKSAAQVMIRIIKLGDDGRPLPKEQGGGSRSYSVVLCEPHAVTAWTEMQKTYNKITN